MIIIREKHSGNEIYYQKVIIVDNKESIDNIKYHSVTIEKNSTKYYVIYTPSMIIDSSSFGFLNEQIIGLADNSRLKAQQALKFLFCFERIINKKIQDFNAADVNNLKYFLHGYSPKGQTLHLDLLTTRNNETVNSYLAIYRQYLSYIGIENTYLQKTQTRNLSIRADFSDINIRTERYTSNDRVAHNPYLEVPMYISVEDFKNILKLVRKNYTLRDEIIIRLMYQTGMRIGEVLGLTAEDLTMEKRDGKYDAIAYIRNRMSDENDQCAKTCMKIKNKKEYKSKEYNTLGYGYQYVILPLDLYNLIDEYIENVHVEFRNNPHTINRYMQKTVADSVTGLEDNYYIFLNSVGTPLHSHSWNSILRSIFLEVGLPVDTDKREHNLNHRFRHGFAMFNVKYLNCGTVDLAKRMRHRSIMSVYKYHCPTVSDQIRIKTDFSDRLYETIPELKRER